ncbi:thioredoxin [Candidatus Saccharibacteria bacterium]|nr:thioredoxin [Candidatus Saccharibacteria bacterium]
MSIIEGTQDNFEAEVLKADKPVLVDFNATWCPPCQTLHPILEKIADERDDVKMVTVDIDEESLLAEDYGVSTIPCLVFFRDGAEYDRRVGLQPEKRILKILGDK